MSPEVSTTPGEKPVDRLIALFLLIAVGAWIVFSATDVTGEVWAWLAVAGVAFIATIVTGVLAGGTG